MTESEVAAAAIENILTRQERLAIQLHYADGLGPSQIGEVLGLSPEAARQTLTSAVEIVQHRIEETRR